MLSLIRDGRRHREVEQLRITVIQQHEPIGVGTPMVDSLERGQELTLHRVSGRCARHPRRGDRAELECVAVERVRTCVPVAAG